MSNFVDWDLKKKEIIARIAGNIYPFDKSGDLNHCVEVAFLIWNLVEDRVDNE